MSCLRLSGFPLRIKKRNDSRLCGVLGMVWFFVGKHHIKYVKVQICWWTMRYQSIYIDVLSKTYPIKATVWIQTLLCLWYISEELLVIMNPFFCLFSKETQLITYWAARCHHRFQSTIFKMSQAFTICGIFEINIILKQCVGSFIVTKLFYLSSLHNSAIFAREWKVDDPVVPVLPHVCLGYCWNLFLFWIFT
jgi:hypothetical protein